MDIYLGIHDLMKKSWGMVKIWHMDMMDLSHVFSPPL